MIKKRTKAFWLLLIGSIAIAAPMKFTGCISAGSNVDPIFSGIVGQDFPKVVGINLEGENIRIPDGLEGETILVIVAFEREQQENVNTWIPKLIELEKSDADFRFYELPVIYKGGAAFRFWVNNGMRSGITDTESRLRTITVYTDREAFNKFIDISDTKQIHLFLLNRNKHIIWRNSGDFSPQKFNAMKKAMNME